MNAANAVPDHAGMPPVTEPSLEPGQVDSLLAQSLSALAAHQGLALGIKRAADGRYVMGNAALAKLLGSASVPLVGRSDADLLDPALAALMRAADHTALAQGGLLASEHRIELGGVRREFQVLRVTTASTALGLGADQRLLCSLWRDLAPQRQRDAQLRAALDQLEELQKTHTALRRELADQSLRDSASGLYSRAHFDDQMHRELDLSAREHREFALVYMALDAHGDRVRELGPAAHDGICEAMGRLLRGNTRAMDASCRIDESHFAVLLSGVGLATAHSRMEGLRRQCATQIVMLDGQELRFTVAMGVASFPHTAHSHVDLIDACTAALAEAQRRGGNTVALASIRFDGA
jgi:diguanylate cyclase (GGDEF)-like protein